MDNISLINETGEWSKTDNRSKKGYRAEMAEIRKEEILKVDYNKNSI